MVIQRMFSGYSEVVQWLFRDCSLVIQRLFSGYSEVVHWLSLIVVYWLDIAETNVTKLVFQMT